MELKSNHLVEPFNTTEIPWVAQLVAMLVVVLMGVLQAMEHNGLDMTSVTKQVVYTAIETKLLILEFPDLLICRRIDTRIYKYYKYIKTINNVLTGLAFFIGP